MFDTVRKPESLITKFTQMKKTKSLEASAEEISNKSAPADSPAKETGEGASKPDGDDADDDGDEEEDPDPAERGEGSEDKPAAATSAAKKSSLFSRANAFLKGKTQLVNELALAHERITVLEAENEQLLSAQTDLEKEAAKAALLDKQLAAAKAEKKTVATGVKDELAKLGVDADDAPALQAEGSIMTREAALEAYASAKTPEEKRAIYTQHKKLLY